GLDFASLTTAPDFSLEPSDVVKVQRISHQAWLEDRAFAFLCRTVKARTDLQAFADWSSKDRWHPPYIHLVHIVAREDPDAKGGLPPDCNILVGTQTEALAEELMRSCLLLKKRRALNRQPSRLEGFSGMWACHDLWGTPGMRFPYPTGGAPMVIERA
ncbi:unnamed protein product, partial [Effrenium voratum]